MEIELTDLFLFFDLDPLIVKAVAVENWATSKKTAIALPDIANTPTLKDRVTNWTKSLSASAARNLVLRFLAEDEATVRAECLAELPISDRIVSWPTVKLNRSFEELVEASEQNAIDKREAVTKANREAAKTLKLREERMAKMVQDS